MTQPPSREPRSGYEDDPLTKYIDERRAALAASREPRSGAQTAPVSAEPLSREEEASLREAMKVTYPNEDNRTEYIRRVLATLDAARSLSDEPAGLREAVNAGRKAMHDRYDDLRWCGKDDDCHVQAKGVALAIDDFEEAFHGALSAPAFVTRSDEPAGLRERIEALPFLDVNTDDEGGGGRMVALDAVLALLSAPAFVTPDLEVHPIQNGVPGATVSHYDHEVTHDGYGNVVCCEGHDAEAASAVTPDLRPCWFCGRDVSIDYLIAGYDSFEEQRLACLDCDRAIHALREKGWLAVTPDRGEGTLDPERPEIVVLCGSTRFYDMFQAANYDLTMLGKIVLSVGFYPHSKALHGHGEGVGHDSTQKVALDELHKRKIDLADRVYVLNVGGYIGESTRSEIDYAVALGKPIDYLEALSTSESDRGEER